MKKIYIQPTTQVVNIAQQAIIAISGFNPNAGDEGIGGGDALSKGSSDWDIWGDGSDSDDEYDY